jgi:soluble lytic murein transglycosylase-like protein
VARTARQLLRPLRLARRARRLATKAKEDKKRQASRIRRFAAIAAVLFFIMFATSFATVGGVGTPPQQQSSFNATLTGLPFAALFEATAELGIDPRLVAAVAWTESGFAADVVSCERTSPAGAQGIMQFMPATARSMNIDPCDPAQAIPAGARYLLTQYERFDSWEHALAAYNAGPGAVEQHGGIPPYAETQAYVPKVMGKWEEYKQRFPTEDLSAGTGSGGPGQPMGSTERYTERSITPTMQKLLDAVVPAFGRGFGIGCYRDGSDGEHPKGRACDFIMSRPLNTMPTPEYLEHGWSMARWLVDNAEEYGVYYVIWQEKIWSSSRPDEGWRPYTRYPNGNLQQNHYDHIHVSVL